MEFRTSLGTCGIITRARLNRIVRRLKLRDAVLLTVLTASLGVAAVASFTFVVRRPMIVAFFPPVTEAELKADPDTNEALSDFQVYAKLVREPLRKAGIDFHEVYARSFRIRVGATVRTFRSGDVDVGYYFVAPGKKPRIEYGVMSAADLLEIAGAYFGIVTK
jgi:hypothetical protein